MISCVTVAIRTIRPFLHTRAGFATRRTRRSTGYRPGQRDPLREELRQTLLDVARLEEENEALRKSAEIWIRMYEGQLARANEAARLWHPDSAYSPTHA